MEDLMTMENHIYKVCPIYKTDIITLRLITKEDNEQLLKCYSDEKSIPLFNSDNCNGDNFHYTTIERMNKAINFWKFSYENKYFVRLSIIVNNSKDTIGTIEMFKREATDDFNGFGILRIDLQSNYEKKEYINEILDIVNNHFYNDFHVNSILTKAIPMASERITSLAEKGYGPLNKKFICYDDYFIRDIM